MSENQPYDESIQSNTTDLAQILLKAFSASANDSVSSTRKGSITSGIESPKINIPKREGEPSPFNKAARVNQKLNSDLKDAVTASLYAIIDLDIAWDLILYSSKGGNNWLETLADITETAMNNNKDIDLEKIASFIRLFTTELYIPSRNHDRKLYQSEKLEALQNKHLPLLNKEMNKYIRQRGNEESEKEIRHLILLGCIMLCRQTCAVIYGNAIGVVHAFTISVCEFFLSINRAAELDPWFNEENQITEAFGEWHQAIATQSSFIESAYATKIRHFSKESFIGDAVVDNPFTEIYYRLTTNPALWNYLQDNVHKIFHATNKFRKQLIDYMNNGDVIKTLDYADKLYTATIEKEVNGSALFTSYIDLAASAVHMDNQQLESDIVPINNNVIARLARAQDSLSDRDTTNILENILNTTFSQLTDLESGLYNDVTKRLLKTSDIGKDSWMAQCFPRIDILSALTVGGIPHVVSISSLFAARQLMIDSDVIRNDTAFLKSVLQSREDLNELYLTEEEFNEHISEESYTTGIIYQYHVLDCNNMGGDSKIPFGHLDYRINEIVNDTTSPEVTLVVDPYIQTNKRLREDALKIVPRIRREMEDAMLSDIEERSKMSGLLARNGRVVPDSIDKLPENTQSLFRTSQSLLAVLKLMKVDAVLSGILTYSIYEDLNNNYTNNANKESETNSNNINLRNISADGADDDNSSEELRNLLRLAHEFLVSIGVTIGNGETVIYTNEKDISKNLIASWLDEEFKRNTMLSSWAQVVNAFTSKRREISGNKLSLPEPDIVDEAVKEFSGVKQGLSNILSGNPALDFAISVMIYLAANYYYSYDTNNVQRKSILSLAYTKMQHFKLRWALDIGPFGVRSYNIITRLSTINGTPEAKTMFDIIGGIALDCTGIGTAVNDNLRRLLKMETKPDLSIELFQNDKITQASKVYTSIYNKLTQKIDDIFIDNFIKPTVSDPNKYKIQLSQSELEPAVQSLDLIALGYDKETINKYANQIQKELIKGLSNGMNILYDQISKGTYITSSYNKAELRSTIRTIANQVSFSQLVKDSIGDPLKYISAGADGRLFGGNKELISKFKITKNELTDALKVVYPNDPTQVDSLTDSLMVAADDNPVLVFIKDNKAEVVNITSPDWRHQASRLNNKEYKILNLLAPNTEIGQRSVGEILYSMSDATTQLGSALRGLPQQAYIAVNRPTSESVTEAAASLAKNSLIGTTQWLSKHITDSSAILNLITLVTGASVVKVGSMVKSIPTTAPDFIPAMADYRVINIQTSTSSMATTLGKGIIGGMARRLLYPAALAIAESAMQSVGFIPATATLAIGYIQLIPFIYLLIILMQYFFYRTFNTYPDELLYGVIIKIFGEFARWWNLILRREGVDASQRGNRNQNKIVNTLTHK